VVADLETGSWQPYDQSIWDDSLGAGTDPQGICWGLGVKLQRLVNAACNVPGRCDEAMRRFYERQPPPGPLR
jgi:hypothetical protein